METLSWKPGRPISARSNAAARPPHTHNLINRDKLSVPPSLATARWFMRWPCCGHDCYTTIYDLLSRVERGSFHPDSQTWP